MANTPTQNLPSGIRINRNNKTLKKNKTLSSSHPGSHFHENGIEIIHEELASKRESEKLIQSAWHHFVLKKKDFTPQNALKICQDRGSVQKYWPNSQSVILNEERIFYRIKIKNTKDIKDMRNPKNKFTLVTQ